MTPASNKQVPDHSIMDVHGKQAYLGNQFLASTNGVSLTGTTEVPIIYLACPAQASSGAFPNQKSLFCDLRNMFCVDVTEATGVVYRMYFNPTTVAAGSVFTPVNARPGNATASIALVRVSPTAVANGTFVQNMAVGFESPCMASDLVILDPGQSMLITAQPSASTVGVVDISWYEL